MTAPITAKNLIAELRAALPELGRPYRRELEPSTVIDQVFKPKLMTEIEHGRRTDFLRRAADFMERVCESPDKRAVFVLEFYVLQRLLPYPEKLRFLWPLLGPNTRATIGELAKSWDSMLDEYEAPPARRRYADTLPDHYTAVPSGGENGHDAHAQDTGPPAGEQITYENFQERLREAFPELEGAYAKCIAKWEPDEKPGNYIVMGDVFNPRFRSEVESGECTDFLRRAGEFMERTFKSGDLSAIEILHVEVFEYLIADRDKLRLLWPVLGKMTKAGIRHAAAKADAIPDERRLPRWRGHRWTDDLPD